MVSISRTVHRTPKQACQFVKLFFLTQRQDQVGSPKTGQTCHVKACEPPLPLYRLQHPCYDEKQNIDIQVLPARAFCFLPADCRVRGHAGHVCQRAICCG